MQLETYDPEKIGKCIAWTGDHSVYEYGPDEVIKFSKFDFFLGRRKAIEKSILDRDLCAKYFGKQYLDTKVVTSSTEDKIALIQPKIKGKFLEIEDLSNPVIRNNYKEFIRGYEKLLSDGYKPVDLIGGKAVTVKKMSNIFVTAGNHLYLFDATILDIDLFPLWFQPFVWLLFQLAIYLQNQRIRQFEVSIRHQSTLE